MDDLSGRVAVVTGAAGGIGGGLARAFASAGMHLVLADLDADRLVSRADALRASAPSVLAVPTDVRDPDAVQALADATRREHGRVDVVCNNAGVWTLDSSWATSADDWRRVVDVNLMGVVHGVRSFVPLLLENPAGGHVVNTASVAGLLGGPFLGPYTATKHAVVGLSKTLRADLALAGGTVGVSVVCPGAVSTGLVDTLPDPTDEAPLPPAAQAMLGMLRTIIPAGLDPDEVGRIVLDAVRTGRFWVLPNAAAHRARIQTDADELFASEWS